jgi:hypothetical protein
MNSVSEILDSKNTEEVILVCRNKETGKIIHIDPDHCHRSIFRFGQYVPMYPCGDLKNIHKCEKVSALQAEYIRQININIRSHE